MTDAIEPDPPPPPPEPSGLDGRRPTGFDRAKNARRARALEALAVLAESILGTAGAAGIVAEIRRAGHRAGIIEQETP